MQVLSLRQGQEKAAFMNLTHKLDLEFLSSPASFIALTRAIENEAAGHCHIRTQGK